MAGPLTTGQCRTGCEAPTSQGLRRDKTGINISIHQLTFWWTYLQVSKQQKKRGVMNRKKSRHKRRANHRAPLARARDFTNRRARMRSSGERMVVSKSELVAAVSMSDVFTVTRYDINPSNDLLFPWLSGLASGRFVEYRFKHLRIHINRSVAATKDGRVYTGCVDNVELAAPTTTRGIMAISQAKSSVIWGEDTISVDLTGYLGKDRHFVLQPDGIPAKADPKTYYAGSFFVALFGENVLNAGDLMVDYEVELFDSFTAGGAASTRLHKGDKYFLQLESENTLAMAAEPASGPYTLYHPIFGSIYPPEVPSSSVLTVMPTVVYNDINADSGFISGTGYGIRLPHGYWYRIEVQFATQGEAGTSTGDGYYATQAGVYHRTSGGQIVDVQPVNMYTPRNHRVGYIDSGETSVSAVTGTKRDWKHVGYYATPLEQLDNNYYLSLAWLQESQTNGAFPAFTARILIVNVEIEVVGAIDQVPQSFYDRMERAKQKKGPEKLCRPGKSHPIHQQDDGEPKAKKWVQVASP